MNSPDPKAQSINEIASAWLERVNAGNWTDENQAELDAWLAESSARRAAYWRLEDAWSNASRLSALHVPMRQPALQQRILPILARTAAVIAIVGVAGIVAAKYFGTPESQTYTTGLGGRETLALSDGSRIELNTGTELRLAADGTQRKVWLDKGEAFFDIKHDASRPFVVITAGHRITDLGTKFVVREAADSLEVTLVEGRARFESADTAIKPQLAFLSPGDVVVATATSMDVTRKSQKDLSAELGWRRGVLVFRHTTLAEAAAEFNRYNTQRLVIGDEKTASLQINGTFKNDDAASFAGTARAVFGLRVEKRGDEIVLSQ